MGYKDKILRLEKARDSDELPLVDELNKLPGAKAWINPSTSPKFNRSQGDVLLRVDNQKWTSAFEMQVSRKYKRFSWGVDKLYKFVGIDGGPCWIILGCLDDDEKSMFFMMTGIASLRQLIDSGHTQIQMSQDGKYYTISPEAFFGVKNKWMGSTVAEMLAEWWKDFSHPTN